MLSKRELRDFQSKAVESLLKVIGRPPKGAPTEEWMPRAATWHEERANWKEEVAALRLEVARLKAQLEVLGWND